MFLRSAVMAAAFLMASLALPAVANAKWLKAESPHFVVYTDRSEASVREYVAMLEDFDALMRRMYGQPEDLAPPRKLDVYLIGSSSQLRRILPQASERIGGFYIAASSDIFAVAIRDSGGDATDPTVGDDVAMHEYVHHFMRQYHAAPYPTWLVEGYAEYYATADLSPKRITIGSTNPGRAYALQNPGWLSMSDVLSKRVGDLKETEQGAFYAQAWLLTHYVLADTGRRAKLAVYLREWQKDGDSEKAWKTAFGQDADGLQRSLRDYIKRPLVQRVIPREIVPPKITISALTPGADDALLETLRIKYGVPAAQRPDLLARLRAVHTRTPDDRFTRIAVARAETLWGDRAAGEAVLQTMIKVDPADAEAMIVLAESLITAGRKAPAERIEKNAQAAKVLGAAMKAAPDDYRVYALYGQTKMGLRGEPSENTLNVLIRAVQLAPQVSNGRLNAASALIAAKANDEARDMLEPLLNDPHSGAVAKQARAMIARMEGREPDKADPKDEGEED